MSAQISSQPEAILRRFRQLAPSASVRISPLFLGATNLDEAYKDGLGECNKETAFAILNHFAGQGCTFIDTANMYQNGVS